MKIWTDYYKVLDVIDSCITVEQLNGASRMLILWLDKHLDYQVYSSTFRNHIEKKFKELNGEEFDKIPYREVTIC
jgi:hypothetical protein